MYDAQFTDNPQRKRIPKSAILALAGVVVAALAAFLIHWLPRAAFMLDGRIDPACAPMWEYIQANESRNVLDYDDDYVFGEYYLTDVRFLVETEFEDWGTRCVGIGVLNDGTNRDILVARVDLTEAPPIWEPLDGSYRDFL